jgi:PAS domain S-box-containing protein
MSTPRPHGLEDTHLTTAALEDAYDAVVITTRQLNLPGPSIVYVNRAFVELTGYSVEEALGNTPRMLQGPATDRRVLDDLRAALEQGLKWRGQAINYRKDGSTFLLEWRVAPVRDPDDHITHWISFQHEADPPRATASS